MENSIISTQDLRIILEALASGSVTIIDILSLIDKTDKKNDEIILTVDYSRTLSEMISIGNYDKRELSIGKNKIFIPPGLLGQKRFINAKLFEFKKEMGSDEAIIEMSKDGFFPANLFELLSFRKDYQRKNYYKLVALGFTYDSPVKEHISVIDCKLGKCSLASEPFNKKWGKWDIFLGVK